MVGTSVISIFAGLFATFPHRRDANGYSKVLFTLAPLEDETTKSASEHHAFIQFLLSVFRKNELFVVKSVGEKMRTQA